MAGIVAELERSWLDAETLRSVDKTPPVGAAPEFSIRDHLQSHAFLHGYDVADALILQLDELGIADLFSRVPAEGLAQGLGAQQAADVIGTKRRAAWNGRRHHAQSLVYALDQYTEDFVTDELNTLDQ
jgi:hypothetical protein